MRAGQLPGAAPELVAVLTCDKFLGESGKLYVYLTCDAPKGGVSTGVRTKATPLTQAASTHPTGTVISLVWQKVQSCGAILKFAMQKSTPFKRSR